MPCILLGATVSGNFYFFFNCGGDGDYDAATAADEEEDWNYVPIGTMG